MPPDDQLADKLTAARAALTPERKNQKESPEEIGEYLLKRKKEASLAMASAEQKAKMQEAIKAMEEKQATEKKLEELEKERHLTETEKKKRLGEEQKKADEEAENTRLQKIKEIIDSKTQIANLKKEQEVEITPLRTFGDDLAKTVRGDKVSVAQIASQQKERQILVEDKNNRWRLLSQKTVLILISLSLLILGTAFTLYVYRLTTKKDNNPILTQQESLIFANEYQEFDLTGKKPEQIQAEIANFAETKIKESVLKESVANLSFIENTTQTINEKQVTKKKKIDSRQFIASTTSITNDFYRFLDKDFMFGFYHGQNTVSPFYLFKVADYGRLADSLLKNGNGIVAELYKLSGKKTEDWLGDSWQDETVKNYDLRVLRDENDQPLAIYVFLDEKTLLFIENEEIFQKILLIYQTPPVKK